MGLHVNGTVVEDETTHIQVAHILYTDNNAYAKFRVLLHKVAAHNVNVTGRVCYLTKLHTT